MRALFVFCALAVCAGCPSSSKPKGPDQMPLVGQALAKRMGKLRDFQLEGTATHNGNTTSFTYTWAQPSFAKATIGDAQTMLFDGDALVVLDHRTKTYARVARDGNEMQLLMALQQTFGDFAIEGWRPPLFRPGASTAHLDGDRWIVSSPIDDDTLAEERTTLRAPDAAFLGKATIDRQAKEVASTKVLESLTDEASGLTLPKRWVKTNPAGTFEVTLSKATLNAGLTGDGFRAAVPEGYKQGS